MTNSAEPTRISHRWSVFLVSFALLFGLGAIWSFATPHMGVPDEPAHVIRAAAVVRGDIIPRQSANKPYISEVDVPAWAAGAHALPCFAFDPNIPASCQPEPANDDSITAAQTSAGINGPGYYAIVGLPSLVLDGASAFYAMRLVNVAVTAALLAAAFMALSQLPRARWSYLALAVAVTPMALYLMGAVNPNSVEFSSAAAVFATLVVVVRTPSPGWLLWERAAIVVMGATLLVNTRSISLLWLALVIALALLVARRDHLLALLRRPATWLMAGLSAVVVVLMFIWFTRPHSDFTVEGSTLYPLIGGNFVLGSQVMLDRNLEFAVGWIGLFGWVDTPSPTLSVLIWCTVIVGLIAASVLFGRGRARLVTVLFVIAAVGIPVVIQGILLPDYGFIWQGRYMMAIYICMMIVAGIALDEAPMLLPEPARRRIIIVLIAAIAIGNLVSFLWVLRRYVVGGGTWSQMLLSPAWQPPLTWIGLGSLFALVVAAAAVVLARVTTGANLRHALHVQAAMSSTDGHARTETSG